MKLTTAFMLVFIFQTQARTFSQNIKLNVKSQSIYKVLDELHNQTGYQFLYSNELLDQVGEVTLKVKNATIDEVLHLCLKDKPVEYTIISNTIIFKKQEMKTIKNESAVSNIIVELPPPPPPVHLTGKVTDENGNPLPKASVLVKGTQYGTTTDENGEFSFDVSNSATALVISYVNYESVEVNIKGRTQINVRMKAKVEQAQDVVVVGYGSVKKELLTGSVGTVKFTETQADVPTTMAGNLLAGQVAGLNVSTPNGIPGQSSPSVTIRTVSSWNSQSALYVIDGKIASSTDFNNLSPLEIDNVTVLKDAATSAVYGSRAAGGVIVVTTKRGKMGKAVINYNFNSGLDKRAKGMSLTSAIETGKLYAQVNPTSDPASWKWSQDDYDYFASHDFGGGKGYGFNQLEIVYRNPYTQTHNLSITGGTEKIKYFIGGSYVNQQGFIRGQDYDKYNLRINITSDITKNLQVFGGVALNYNFTNSTTSTYSGDPTAMYQKLLLLQPNWPVWTNGHKPIDYGWVGNLGAEVEGQGGYLKGYYLKPVITLSATYKAPFLPGLSATASFIKSFTDSHTRNFVKQYTLYTPKKIDNIIWDLNDADITGSRLSTQSGNNYSTLQEYGTWNEDRQLNLQLNYERTFAGVHHVKGWLIYERYETTGDGVNAWINGFPVYVTDQFWAASTSSVNQYVSNSTTYSTTETGRKSWVGQFFYDYASKYLASFAYRYDGSALFAPDYRWGFFPSGSLGWIISKENFFKKVKGIDMLKLRASVGLIGNDAIGGWQWQQSYTTGNSAYFGTSPSASTGITYGAITNPKLTWEKSLNENFAVDVEFLKNFSATVEYWHTYTYDILGSRIQTTPPTFSRSLPAVNYGKEKSQGFELTFGYKNKFGNVNLFTSINASYGYAWYILRDQNITYDYQRYKGNGRTTTDVTGYKVAGMIRTQTDLNTLVTAMPNYKFNGYVPQLGQLYYKDLNSQTGVGVSDGTIDNYDITVLRKNNDPIVVGWNLNVEWKGISLTANFNGQFRQWKSFNDLAGGVEWQRMWKPWYSNSWTATNTNAWLPIRYSTNDATKTVINSGSNFWYANASFLRLKYLSLSYNLPRQLYGKYGINNINIYASGSNLFVISKFNKKYYDPEMSSGSAFPIIRSYNIGISASF